MLSFLGITGHFITQDWRLESLTIDFIKLSGEHTGKNIAKFFTECIKEKFDIWDKVSII
jgi:hypothetical protein